VPILCRPLHSFSSMPSRPLQPSLLISPAHLAVDHPAESAADLSGPALSSELMESPVYGPDSEPATPADGRALAGQTTFASCDKPGTKDGGRLVTTLSRTASKVIADLENDSQPRVILSSAGGVEKIITSNDSTQARSEYNMDLRLSHCSSTPLDLSDASSESLSSPYRAGHPVCLIITTTMRYITNYMVVVDSLLDPKRRA
jgi:hypothetical protein